MEKHNKTVILARVSSKSQEDEGYSLDSQLKLLTNYCDNKGLKIDKVFRIAETASKQQSRKIFQELLTYLYKNDIYHLAVEKTDRLTRNFRDAVAVDDWLEQNEARMLHAVKENLLLHKQSKSDVKFMWNIHLAVAKKYADNLREEAMKGWAEKLAQGWLPASPPPGYVTVINNGKRIHVPDLKTKSVIQSMFKLYLESNSSIDTITAEMESLGLRTRSGHPYVRSKVQKMLKNPFYIGINRFDGKDYPGAQEPIISNELFNKVQQKMHLGRPNRYKQHNPTFKNMITCSECGGKVTWQLQKGRYYGCCQNRKVQCKGKKFMRECDLEQAVVCQLKQLVCPSPSIIAWVADRMRKEHQTNVEQREQAFNLLKYQLERLKRMEEMLYDDKLAGEISKEKYDVKHEEFRQQRLELEDKYSEVENSINNDLERRIVILKLSQKAADIFLKKTPDEKRLIMTELFDEVTATQGIVSVKLTKFSKAIAQNVQETIKLMEA